MGRSGRAAGHAAFMLCAVLAMPLSIYAAGPTSQDDGVTLLQAAPAAQEGPGYSEAARAAKVFNVLVEAKKRAEESGANNHTERKELEAKISEQKARFAILNALETANAKSKATKENERKKEENIARHTEKRSQAQTEKAKELRKAAKLKQQEEHAKANNAARKMREQAHLATQQKLAKEARELAARRERNSMIFKAKRNIAASEKFEREVKRRTEKTAAEDASRQWRIKQEEDRVKQRSKRDQVDADRRAAKRAHHGYSLLQTAGASSRSANDVRPARDVKTASKTREQQARKNKKAQEAAERARLKAAHTKDNAQKKAKVNAEKTKSAARTQGEASAVAKSTESSEVSKKTEIQASISAALHAEEHKVEVQTQPEAQSAAAASVTEADAVDQTVDTVKLQVDLEEAMQKAESEYNAKHEDPKSNAEVGMLEEAASAMQRTMAVRPAADPDFLMQAEAEFMTLPVQHTDEAQVM